MGSLMTRKRFLVGAAAAAGALATRPVRAARTTVIRLGLDLPTDHPTTVNAIEAGRKIKDATKGAVDLQVFPNSQLGDDTHMLSNLRSGAMQMMAIGDNILGTLVPSAAIDNVGFAFDTVEKAWAALDGGVGDIVRADIAKTGLVPMHRIWDEGLPPDHHQPAADQHPEDLHGLKMRVPPSPISLSIFQSLGAAPGHDQRLGTLHGAADPCRRRAGESARQYRDDEAVPGAENTPRCPAICGSATGCW